MLRSRKQIEAEYIVEFGIITSPGKFENEPVYLPYYYDVYLMGCSEEIESNYFQIEITPGDWKEFSELKDLEIIVLHISDDGFVSESWKGAKL